MSITLIVAMDRNRVIGKQDHIPWHLATDMDHFKKTTKNHTVVMGRKTYKSIPRKFKPLPNRVNVVLTSDPSFDAPGCIVVHSIENILRISVDKELFVMGGGEIYRLLLPYANRLIVTRVETMIRDGDTFFPQIEGRWKSRLLFRHETVDEQNDFPFSVIEYTKQ